MKKCMLLIGLVAVLLMVFNGLVFAATPQSIYDDFADNGVLDGTYTESELRAYLNNTTLHQYPPDATKVRSLNAVVRGMLSSRDRFPFTGFEVGFMVLGVVALLAVGLGLRRLAHTKK